MNAEEKKVLMGVSGGIAAYKAADCASKLSQAGFDVHVAMSPGALEFLRPLTFAAVTGNRVIDTIFPKTSVAERNALYPHIYPASEAGLFLLAPASADMLAKVALGLGDDIVCASVLALADGCKKIFCPAMHHNMWTNSAVQKNAALLVESGWRQVGPKSGKLACGSEGPGRMAEPKEIVDECIQQLEMF